VQAGLMNFDPDGPTSNLDFCRAISLAIDRGAFVNDIIGLPGTTRIDSVFPSGFLGQNQSFQKEFPPFNILTNETALLQAAFMQGQLMSAGT
jgi:ABC-type transport system substrate-binding protein